MQDYFCHWSVVSHSHWGCWWGMQEVEQGNIRYQGDSPRSPSPWGPLGLSPPCGQLLDVIFIAIFTGHGLAATLTWEFLVILNVLFVSDNGANPHQYNHWGFTALFMAADDTATLREILNEKVNTNELVGERGEAAIHLAAVTGSVENVRLLLDHGSDINLLTMHNETALWLAVWRGHSDLVTMLLRLNCSINDCSNSCQVYAWDYLPVEIAIGNASFDIMKMLFRVGCSLRNPVYFDRDSEGSLPGIPWLRVRPEVLHFLLQYEPEQKWVKSFLQNPRSLKDLSRLVIRKVSSSSVRLEKEVHELPVPPSLQDYLLWPELGLDWISSNWSRFISYKTS